MGTRLASFLCHNKSIESFGGRNFTSAAVTSHDEEDEFGRWGWWIICIYDNFNAAAQYEWMKEWWRSFVFIRSSLAKHTRRQFYYHKPQRQHSTLKSAGEDTKYRWKLVLPLLWTANKKSSEIIINKYHRVVFGVCSENNLMSPHARLTFVDLYWAFAKFPQIQSDSIWIESRIRK